MVMNRNLSSSWQRFYPNPAVSAELPQLSSRYSNTCRGWYTVLIQSSCALFIQLVCFGRISLPPYWYSSSWYVSSLCCNLQVTQSIWKKHFTGHHMTLFEQIYRDFPDRLDMRTLSSEVMFIEGTQQRVLHNKLCDDDHALCISRASVTLRPWGLYRPLSSICQGFV